MMQCYELYDSLMSKREHLFDVDWLASFLKPHCFSQVLGLSGSPLHIRQNPYEFAEFLIFMGKRQIGSYLEIGVLRGGSWFMVDSFLRATNPNYNRTVGYDRSNFLRNWNRYHRRFSTIEFRLQDSKDMNLKDEEFDMAFIDATHTEEAVFHDFNKVKQHCRYVAFHDIVLPEWGVGKVWEKIKSLNSHWEFVDKKVPQTCGIGVISID
jgi:hypothetical protein